MNVEEKYRSGAALNNEDVKWLKLAIVSDKNQSHLESYIYIFGRSSGIDYDVIQIIDGILFNGGLPGLSAVCLKVVTDFWSVREEKYADLMAAFIDYEMYEDWYDEVAYCSGVVRRFPGYIPDGDALLSVLMQVATEKSDLDLVELLKSREK